jgi:hypothetical protein
MRRLLPLALLLLGVVPANATVIQAMDFDAKVENASSIVLGRCVAQESKWDEGRNWILTYSTFEVERAYKGAPASRITVVTPGGTVGNIAQEVVGVPRFREGEEHVLFVRDSQAGPTVLYLEQGDYRVVRDGRGERVVHPVVSSEVTIDGQRGIALAKETTRPLRDFERLVRDTERRREAIRMEVLERERREEASFWNQVKRNRALVILAVIGVALATWQLVRKN